MTASTRKLDVDPRRSVSVAAAIAVAAAVCVSACGGGTTDTSGGTATAAQGASGALDPGAPLAGYNLLLVTLDTLRADRLGSYGYAGAETPVIDRLAAEGVRFDRVTTTVPATLPAHASIMTGLTPFRHGVRNNGAFVLAGDATTLAEALGEQGYATGGFIGAVVLDAQFGIAQGFDHFNGLGQYQARTGDLSGERPGEQVVARAGEWIRAQNSPYFAWVHLYDAHDPYEPPEPYASRHADDLYDGEVAYVDAMVGRLLQALDEAGDGDSTLVVITADHGEGLGDHGEGGHSLFIYDSTVRVPLVFWAPGKVPAGVVATGGTSVVDIFPTVLSLLGIPVPPGVGAPAGSAGSSRGGASAGSGGTSDSGASADAAGGSGPSGIDLAPRFADPQAAGSDAYAESLIPYLDFGWSELRALVADGYKYIEAPEPELYGLAEDPGEAHNLVDIDIDRADGMAEQLAALVAGDDVAAAAGVAVDADSVAALQALGYLAGGGPSNDRRDIDPKDMIDTYETFVDGLVDASDAIDEGRYGDANEVLVQLDELLPDQYIVYYYFGRLASEAGDPPTAVGVLERALELNPSYLPTYTQLANALYATGDEPGALDLIAQAQAMFPDNFSLTLQRGAIAHDAGDLDAALAAYREAERLQPDDPDLLERLGHLHLLRQEPAEAVSALRRLVQLTPESAPAWAQLALGLAQTGRAQDAEDALDRAVELDPDDALVLQVAQQLR